MQDDDYDLWKNRLARILQDIRDDDVKYSTPLTRGLYKNLNQVIREFADAFDIIQKRIVKIDERLNEIEKKIIS